MSKPLFVVQYSALSGRILGGTGRGGTWIKKDDVTAQALESVIAWACEGEPIENGSARMVQLGDEYFEITVKPITPEEFAARALIDAAREAEKGAKK